MKVQTFEQYASEHGGSYAGFGDAALHVRGPHKSIKVWQRMVALQTAKDQALSDRRRTLAIEYAAAVESGAVRPPTDQESLENKAAGHPDKESTQAAIRVLEKRRQRALLALS